MPNLADFDPDVITNCITKLEALNPIADELEAFNATRAVKQAELAEAKAELASVAAERDRARADYAAARAELVVIQGALATAYRERDEIDRQLKKMKGELR
jgi:chromosome segregation ATPase